MSEKIEEMNLHQKILKIANIAGVLQKTKAGFNYKYVPEEEIQAKVTAGMQKYHVTLIPDIINGSTEVIPYNYIKQKKEKIRDENNKEKTILVDIPVNEIIVKSDVRYIFTNADKPEEQLSVGWIYIGQMEDAAMASGSGATYGNRYFLLKAFQLATSEADPDAYRAKQKKAEMYEETEEMKGLAAEIIELGTKLIGLNEANKKIVPEIVSKHNEGNPNPNSIKDVENAKEIIEELKKLIKEAGNKETKTKKEVK